MEMFLKNSLSVITLVFTVAPTTYRVELSIVKDMNTKDSYHGEAGRISL